MDMGYSKDPYQSFRIFQGKIYSEYRRMVHEYDFTKIDATEAPDVQQAKVREILDTKIDLPRYRWQGRVYPQQNQQNAETQTIPRQSNPRTDSRPTTTTTPPSPTPPRPP